MGTEMEKTEGFCPQEAHSQAGKKPRSLKNFKAGIGHLNKTIKISILTVRQMDIHLLRPHHCLGRFLPKMQDLRTQTDQGQAGKQLAGAL